MDKTTFKYFAYGSNMLTRRLTARTPSAMAVTTGYVKGRRLTFDKVSQDGSGKCDAESTGADSDRVYGIVFEIAKAEEKALDDAEGYRKGYDDTIVKVVTTTGELETKTYIATNKEPVLRPYNWYKALTIAGAIEHGLPKEYVEWVRTIESVEDPNRRRRKENEALLFEQPDR